VETSKRVYEVETTNKDTAQRIVQSILDKKNELIEPPETKTGFQVEEIRE